MCADGQGHVVVPKMVAAIDPMSYNGSESDPGFVIFFTFDTFI